jgi:hypothetical protein
MKLQNCWDRLSGHQVCQDSRICGRQHSRSVVAYFVPIPALISDSSPIAVILLIVLFIKIKAKVADRRAASETYNSDAEEEEVRLMFDDEQDGAVSDSDPSEVSVPAACSDEWSSPSFTRPLLSTVEK